MKRIEDTIETIEAAIVTVGPSGFGPWQKEEMYACLSSMKGRGKRVIPVLLPDARKEPPLPLFLQGRQYFSMMNGLNDDKIELLRVAVQTPLSPVL
jgi:hypothetical protein